MLQGEAPPFPQYRYPAGTQEVDHCNTKQRTRTSAPGATRLIADASCGRNSIQRGQLEARLPQPHDWQKPIAHELRTKQIGELSRVESSLTLRCTCCLHNATANVSVHANAAEQPTRALRCDDTMLPCKPPSVRDNHSRSHTVCRVCCLELDLNRATVVIAVRADQNPSREGATDRDVPAQRNTTTKTIVAGAVASTRTVQLQRRASRCACARSSPNFRSASACKCQISLQKLSARHVFGNSRVGAVMLLHECDREVSSEKCAHQHQPSPTPAATKPCLSNEQQWYSK